MRRFLLCMAILLLPALVFGQAQTTGRVTGKVVDEEGNPVAGARVTLISSALQGERIVKTADNGVFLAALLPVGPYAVEISAPGMQPISLSFRLGVGQTVPLDVVLKQGEQIVEEVTVYGTATPLETTSLGGNFDYAVGVEELPIRNRQVENVATYAPNISFGPTPGTLAISGAPSFDTVVLLDGAEVSDPYFGSAPVLYIEDAVEEVQVMTSGISARYGRFQGGVVNAITKTGGNSFDGMARAQFNKQSWNDTTPFNETQADDLNQVYQLTLGGYMLKDHLWFFVGGRTIPETSTANTTRLTQESFTTVSTQDRWQLKLRGAITADHVLEVNYLDYENAQVDRAGLPAGEALAAQGQRLDPRTIGAFVYQGVLTPNAFLDFQVTQKEVSIVGGPTDDGRSPFMDFDRFAVFNNHWWDANDPTVRDNETVGLNLTQAISTSNWGSHTIEYGAQYVNSITGGENRQSVTGLNLLTTASFRGYNAYPFTELDGSGNTVFNLDSYLQTGGMRAVRWDALGLAGDQELQNIGVYVQDTWEIQKWRFDIGLRWDDYDGSGPLPTQNIKFDKLAPRLGVTYNINQNWQVQTTWGRYVSRFQDAVFGAVTGVGAAPYVETLYTGLDAIDETRLTMEAILRDTAPQCVNAPAGVDGAGNPFPGGTCWGIATTVTDPAQPTQYVEAGLAAPYADDFNFSVRYALPRNSGSLVFAFTDRRFKQLVDDFVGDDGVSTVVDPKPADPNNPLTLMFDSTVWRNTNEAKRQYQALAIVADWRPSANWGIGGNYTYSQTQGNYEGEARNQVAIGSTVGDWVRSRNDATAVPFGFLDEDIPHRFQAWGNYRWNFDRAGQFVLGAIYNYRSGQIWNKVASVGFSPDPGYLDSQNNSYNYFFDGRGSDRFNGWWSADLSARYQFPIWKRLQGWLKVDITNVTNEGTLIQYDTSATSTLANQTPVIDPNTGDPVEDSNGDVVMEGGVLTWTPLGSCGGVGGPTPEAPSLDCSGFGKIRNQNDYQRARTYLFTFGLVF